MRAITHSAETIKGLKRVKGFAEHFPQIMEAVAEGKVLLWTDSGEPHPLSQEHIEHIETLEDYHSDSDLAVYAVLNNNTVIMGRPVHMICYLVVTDDGYDISNYNADIYYALADVVNTSWNINEMGSVLITPINGGAPHRVG